jgi:4-nitrophenyl phosphatase
MPDHLASIRSLIIDMDGVLYRGNEPIPGLTAFFDFLYQHAIGFILATNNSTRPPRKWAEKLGSMGVQVPPDSIMTSATATADFLAGQYPAGTRMFYVGEYGIQEALEECGFIIDDQKASAVVVGMDQSVTYEKLAKATLLIRDGARFIGTNPDKTLPIPEGEIPGAGSIQAALVASTDVTPLIIGKPEPYFYELAREKLGGTRETTAAIGDRMDTDIAGAKRTGIYSVLVLTGVSTREEAEAHAEPPDLIVQDISDLVTHWKRALDGDMAS